MDPAAKLRSDLRASIRLAINSPRPILTHLNGDTTWLLQIPYPTHTAAPEGRSHFNLLIDPWLTGPQSDVAGWFSTQWHVVVSCVQSIAELNEILCEANQIAVDSSSPSESLSGSPEDKKHRSFIDAVAISHEFTDHCHKSTLLEVDPSVPIFATEKAVELIRSWNHFNDVHLIPSFSPQSLDWRSTSFAPLPSWIGISRVVSSGNALYYHSALLFSFSTDQVHESTKADQVEAAEAVIYSPHGIAADDLGVLADSHPKLHTLALLHGLHDVGIHFVKQLNLGAFNGLKAQRVSQAKWWITTHDEVKKGGGLIAPFLRRARHTLQKALEREEVNHKSAPGSVDLATKVNFAELGSGESLVLA